MQEARRSCFRILGWIFLILLQGQSWINIRIILCPGHWHKAVELFYVESGEVEYNLPSGKICFPAGSGGLLNSNILHASRGISLINENVEFCHIFDASLIAGGRGSRIEEKYVLPLITVPQAEMIALYPGNPVHQEILKMIRNAFDISEKEFGFEIHLRAVLSEIWIRIFQQAVPLLAQPPKLRKNNDKIKDLMIYVHQHYSEKLVISQLASAVFLSERECFRIFQECLHMTPMQYIQNYRLQMACQMLGGNPRLRYRDQPRLRPWKQQLLRQGFPGIYELHSGRVQAEDGA